MPVVINEVEVVTPSAEQPKAQAGPGATALNAPAAKREIERHMRRIAERRLRVRTY